ncbi:hypothetical protein ACIHCV_26025 [Streptomyces sp. NPDC051956]|uniref:hypothetical protein n=1 Tax=Streptomyces sp. NPDC051956 TaxID=3365677 RepID=UPI0037D26B23
MSTGTVTAGEFKGGAAVFDVGRPGAGACSWRALLADPPVLVLDEPAEGLDPDTAAVLADTLDATRSRTTLLITHEPPGRAAADRIMIIDRGRIRPATPDGVDAAQPT